MYQAYAKAAVAPTSKFELLKLAKSTFIFSLSVFFYKTLHLKKQEDLLLTIHFVKSQKTRKVLT